MDTAKSTKTDKSATKTAAFRPIRLKQRTFRKLQKLLEVVNKKDYGKRVRADSVIDAALGLVGNREIEGLRLGSMTNADRFEMAFRHHVANKGAIGRDDFLGQLLAGKVVVPGKGGTSTEISGRGDGAS